MPISESTYVTVLWAASERYRTPHLITAVSASLGEMYPGEARRLLAEAEQWFHDFGDKVDGPWRFWTTDEAITTPPALAGGKECDVRA